MTFHNFRQFGLFVVHNFGYCSVHPNQTDGREYQDEYPRTGPKSGTSQQITKDDWPEETSQTTNPSNHSSYYTNLGWEIFWDMFVNSRKLFHSRDIGEPFGFLTWFEFAPEDETAFNELLTQLCQSEEWKYVDREIDIRLTRIE